ncbi:MAG: IPTL-CTERM sorting domain-containing protein, partial [Acidobacteria bacterium]|nr:IPTL-CTERM sorting domain-containing protein [Acidobacteriota bacterium]
VEEQKLTASDGAANDRFGFSVSVSGDTAVVGAERADCAAGNRCGAAYFFRFNGTSWVEEQKLTPSDPAAEDRFGYFVSVSGDTGFVGAFLDDCAAGLLCGSVYVFDRDVPCCGDENVDPGEECDDAGESASCDTDCTVAECGDGTLNVTAGEECDDAGESASCDTDCTVAECGDGTLNVTAGEECDGMDDTDCPGACLTDCTCEPVEGIPTVSEWGLIGMAVLAVVAAGSLYGRRRVGGIANSE